MDRMDRLGIGCIDRAGCGVFQISASMRRMSARVAATQTMKLIDDKFRSLSSIAALVICAAWLAGCATDPADVEDRSIEESPSLQSPPARPKTPPPGGSYRVVKGDTLYSIAFRRGLDYRDVAAWNGISAPEYKILVGQEIRFSPPGAQAAASARTPAAAVEVASAPPPASSSTSAAPVGP